MRRAFAAVARSRSGRRMTGRESEYFTLALESLRAIAAWAAECAQRALPLFEECAGSDSRPRAAIEGIREFAEGGKRVARLRSLAMEAHAAAREIDDPAATAAARAAGLAAASAYTHPLADVQQTKHIVGPAAYAALALELRHCGESSVGDEEVRWAIEHAPAEAREVLAQMPARQPGTSRLDRLLYEVDAGIRARSIARIIQASTESDIEAARGLFSEYAASLGIDLGFQGFESEMATLPGDYVPPLGALLLAVDNDRALGCVALRPLESAGIGELKRLYVTPAGRGQGIGLRLTQAVLRLAHSAGYERVRLDTLPSMRDAQRMYERLGFVEIGAYRHNPVESARFLELEL